MDKVNQQAIEAFLQQQPEWQLKQDKLYRSFKFENFSQAFAFMARVALLAERLNHHPDWSNCYNRVEIELITHDAGGLSEKDLEMAAAISDLF